MKVIIIALAILSVAWAQSAMFTSLQVNGIGSVNDHGNLECAVHFSVMLSYYDQGPDSYEFYLIQQKS